MDSECISLTARTQCFVSFNCIDAERMWAILWVVGRRVCKVAAAPTVAAIAQVGKRQTEDLKVPGSIPGLGITCGRKLVLCVNVLPRT